LTDLTFLSKVDHFDFGCKFSKCSNILNTSMNKSPNYDLVNVLVEILKEFQLVYCLGEPLTIEDKEVFKALFMEEVGSPISEEFINFIDVL